jgi:hypothetical protein
MTTIGFYFRHDANRIRRALAAIAAEYGMTAIAGPTAGQGNPAELMASIAAGKTAVVLLGNERRGAAAAWLREQATVADPDLRESLATIAEELEAASRREWAWGEG